MTNDESARLVGLVMFPSAEQAQEGVELLEPLPMPVRGILLIAYGDFAYTISN